MNQFELDFDEFQQQIQEDFPMVGVHPVSMELSNRHNLLLRLAISNYIDLVVKEQEHKNRYAFKLNCENWSKGKMSYADLLTEAKAVVTHHSVRETVVKEHIKSAYQTYISNRIFRAVKYAIQHMWNCAYVALYSDIFEDFE